MPLQVQDKILNKYMLYMQYNSDLHYDQTKICFWYEQQDQKNLASSERRENCFLLSVLQNLASLHFIFYRKTGSRSQLNKLFLI